MKLAILEALRGFPTIMLMLLLRVICLMLLLWQSHLYFIGPWKLQCTLNENSFLPSSLQASCSHVLCSMNDIAVSLAKQGVDRDKPFVGLLFLINYLKYLGLVQFTSPTLFFFLLLMMTLP